MLLIFYAQKQAFKFSTGKNFRDIPLCFGIRNLIANLRTVQKMFVEIPDTVYRNTHGVALLLLLSLKIHQIGKDLIRGNLMRRCVVVANQLARAVKVGHDGARREVFKHHALPYLLQ